MANPCNGGLHALLEEPSSEDLCQKREASAERDSDRDTADRTESTATPDELSEREEPQGGPWPDRRDTECGGRGRAGLPRGDADAREAEAAFGEEGTPIGRATLVLPPYLPSCGPASLLVPDSLPFFFTKAGHRPPGVFAAEAYLPGACPPPPAAPPAGAWPTAAPPVPPPPPDGPALPGSPAAARAWTADALAVPPPPDGPALPGSPAAARRGRRPPPARAEEAAAPLPALPSVGSALHAQGRCKPCVFVHSKGCENGLLCEFCHLCDEGEKSRRRKEKTISRREAQRTRRRPRGTTPRRRGRGRAPLHVGSSVPLPMGSGDLALQCWSHAEERIHLIVRV